MVRAPCTAGGSKVQGKSPPNGTVTGMLPAQHKEHIDLFGWEERLRDSKTAM